jgi:hypothetical protein
MLPLSNWPRASLAGTAAALNERGIPPASGRGTWQAVQVLHGRMLIAKQEILLERLEGRELADGKALLDNFKRTLEIFEYEYRVAKEEFYRFLDHRGLLP